MTHVPVLSFATARGDLMSERAMAVAAPSLPIRLCQDCRFYIADGNLCGHDTALHIDYVRGDHKRFLCATQRTCPVSNACGREAVHFEPVERVS